MKTFTKHTYYLLYLTALCFAIPSKAGLPADMKLTAAAVGSGQPQVIAGEMTQKGREGLWRVNAFNLEIQRPYDSATGQTTGNKVFKPFSVVVEAGALQTLALHKLLADNTTLATVEIRFWQPKVQGGGGGGGGTIEVNYLTVRLTNARIVALRDWMPNTKDPDLVKFPEQHQVEFSYEKIQWTATGNSTVDGPVVQ